MSLKTKTVSFTRWFLFISVGLPVQFIMYSVYPIACALWYVFVYKRLGWQILPPHGPEAPQVTLRNNGLYLNNLDNHGAFTMYGFIGEAGLERLITDEGDFIRRVREDWSNDMRQVSGDVVGAWAFALILQPPSVRVALRSSIKAAIDNHVKYLGTRSDDGWVSNKANNVGLNYCPDGWMGLGQPAAGPQFYTTSALLALGYDLGFKYKALFWGHWLLLGGWYWPLFPLIYTKASPLHYVRDITMKALYVHLQTFGARYWITFPMRFIAFEISEYRNDLFCAMMGASPVPTFPECTSPFFSQRANAAATPDAYSNSPFIKATLNKISRETRIKE